MRRRCLRLLLVLVVGGILLGGGAPRLFVHSARAAGHAKTAFAPPRFATAPSPSGAVASVVPNDTFDAAIQNVGSPPANSGFESVPQSVGTPPANSSFSAASTVAGNPPANNAFTSGDLTGWTASGSPTPPVLTDPTYGHYANLSGSAALTSSPFTVDPTAQVLAFNAFYQTSSGAWINVYALSGTGYATKTQIDSPLCFCASTWRAETADLSPYRGQSIELQFAAYYGAVGITAVTPLVALPNWTTTGPVARATDSQQNAYAALGGGTITSSAFTARPHGPSRLAAGLRPRQFGPVPGVSLVGNRLRHLHLGRAGLRDAECLEHHHLRRRWLGGAAGRTQSPAEHVQCRRRGRRGTPRASRAVLDRSEWRHGAERSGRRTERAVPLPHGWQPHLQPLHPRRNGATGVAPVQRRLQPRDVLRQAPQRRQLPDRHRPRGVHDGRPQYLADLADGGAVLRRPERGTADPAVLRHRLLRHGGAGAGGAARLVPHLGQCRRDGVGLPRRLRHPV